MIIRPAQPADAPEMAAILNRIIAIGGTTAHQHPKSVHAVAEAYIAGPEVLCAHVALTDDAVIIGFQAVERHADLPEGWGDIGTFVQPDIQARGIGAALFAATRAAAVAAGVRTINATIRADNRPGLAYYARMGFVDHDADPDWCLDDGRRVGRVSRRFDLPRQNLLA